MRNNPCFRKSIPGFCTAVLLLAITPVSQAQAADPPFVQVGNVGNAADPLTGLGHVDHDFRIGKSDVTIADYTRFLNAVAKRDKYRLYAPHKMDQIGRESPTTAVSKIDSGWKVGILQTGAPGSFVYEVIQDSGNIPVGYLTWFAAARYCNWLHNGQSTNPESTETGAYTLNGDYRNGGEVRNPGAKFWIPSADEWYKAAYYDPQLNGGTGGYWKFATQSNSPPGNRMSQGSNNANGFVNGMPAVPSKRGEERCVITPAGAFPNSHSYYGCLDMCGNCAQWTDTYIHTRKKSEDGRAMVGGGAGGFTWELTSTKDAGMLRTGYPDRTCIADAGLRIATTP